jgi:hypothetical protein
VRPVARRDTHIKQAQCVKAIGERQGLTFNTCFPRNATVIDSGLSSISVALWRHYSGISGQAVLQPREKAVAIVALLRTVTATNHAVVSHRVMCQR